MWVFEQAMAGKARLYHLHYSKHGVNYCFSSLNYFQFTPGLAYAWQLLQRSWCAGSMCFAVANNNLLVYLFLFSFVKIIFNGSLTTHVGAPDLLPRWAWVGVGCFLGHCRRFLGQRLHLAACWHAEDGALQRNRANRRGSWLGRYNFQAVYFSW